MHEARNVFIWAHTHTFIQLFGNRMTSKRTLQHVLKLAKIIRNAMLKAIWIVMLKSGNFFFRSHFSLLFYFFIRLIFWDKKNRAALKRTVTKKYGLHMVKWKYEIQNMKYEDIVRTHSLNIASRLAFDACVCVGKKKKIYIHECISVSLHKLCHMPYHHIDWMK